MDWTLCVICQKQRSEDLKCPMKSTLSEDAPDVYSNFLQNVDDFRATDALPVIIKFGPDVNSTTLIENKAKWHKSCHLKFSKSKLVKAQKRKESSGNDNEEVRVKHRRQSMDVDKCTF